MQRFASESTDNQRGFRLLICRSCRRPSYSDQIKPQTAGHTFFMNVIRGLCKQTVLMQLAYEVTLGCSLSHEYFVVRLTEPKQKSSKSFHEINFHKRII